MRMYYNTKYEYWKWILLQKHTKLISKTTKRNIVAVYNPIKDIIFRYDVGAKKKIKTKWEGFDWLFKNCLGKFLNIDEIEQFYTSLPNKKKKIFWDCFTRSCYEKNHN